MKTKKKVAKKSGDMMTDIASELAKEFEIQVMSEETEDQVPYYIPFKHKGLQYITGGVPGGRITEIIGDSQCGKSYLLYELIASVLDLGGHALLVDPEVAYEPRFGKKVGISGNKRFFYSTKKSLETFFTMSRRVITKIRAHDKTSPILIGLDSYPPLMPNMTVKELSSMKDEKDLKGYIYAKKNGILGILIGEFTGFLADNNATLVMVNQGREKMGVMFGESRTSNAENIMKFYATLRLWGRVGKKIKEEIPGSKAEAKKRQVGVFSTWDTAKNRNIPPHKFVETKIVYETGVQSYSGLRDLLVAESRVKPLPKNCFIYRGEKYGPKDIRTVIQKNPHLLKWKEKETKKKVGRKKLATGK